MKLALMHSDSVVISEIFPHWNFFSSNWFTVSLTVWKRRLICYHDFSQNLRKNFVKLTFSQKSNNVSQFDEKKFQWGKISEITTYVLCSHWKNISSNQLFRVFFSKKVVFTRNFCHKSASVNFCNYHTVFCHTLWKLRNFTPTKKYFVKSLI